METTRRELALLLVLTVLLTTLVVGGGVYLWQQNRRQAEQVSLNDRISTLEREVAATPTPSPTTTATPATPSPSAQASAVATATPTTTPESGDAAQAVAGEFYAKYLEAEANQGSTKTLTDFYLTSSLNTHIQQLKDSGTINYDPIICAQDAATGVETAITKATSTEVDVQVKEFNGSTSVNTTLVPVNGAWKINTITCP